MVPCPKYPAIKSKSRVENSVSNVAKFMLIGHNGVSSDCRLKFIGVFAYILYA